MSRRVPLFSALALVLALPLGAWACRYSIRDTGFVDLGAPTYRLVLVTATGESSGEATLAALYRTQAAPILAQANVEFESRPAAANEERSVYLADATGRRLSLANGAGIPTEPNAVARLVAATVQSPRRHDILRETLRSHAVVVLVEGIEPAENARVRNAIEGAITTVTRLLPSFPKPVSVPPQLVTLSRAEQSAEASLIWGLGFDPQAQAEARVAVVYGRGRRLGGPLEGPLITRTALQERLALIGQDCECDLDRRWLSGPLLPARWDRGAQQLAASTLGFDPENPLVRTEVTRIVLRGEGEGVRQRRPSTVAGLGYVEEAVDGAGGDHPVEEPESVAEPRAAGGAEPSRPPVTPVTPVAPAASGASAAAASSAAPPPVAVKARTLWYALGGALTAGIVAGVWVAVRSGRTLG